MELFDETYQLIESVETPTSNKFCFPKLYKFNLRKNYSVWQIGYNGKDVIYFHGEENNKIQGPFIITIPSNLRGKTQQEKVMNKMRSAYKSKINKEYSKDPTQENRKFKGMKAHLFYDHIKKLYFPVFLQPKLDGVRLVAYKDENQEIKLVSFSGITNFKYLDKIRNDLDKFFDYFPDDTVFDGELYNPKMIFSDISGILRRINERPPDINKIQFHIFDITTLDLTPEPFENRYFRLKDNFEKFIEENPKNNLRLVDVYQAKNLTEIKKIHHHFVSKGIEGTMVRSIAYGAEKGSDRYQRSLYESKRSFNVLKMKDFIDKEVLVIGVKESSGKQAGMAIPLVKDEYGNEFYVSCEIDNETQKEWLKHPEMIIGKKATIKYFSLTINNIPRNPIFVAIRDYE